MVVLAVTVVLVVVPDRVIRDTVAGDRRPIWSDDFSGSAGASPDAGRWRHAEGGDGWGNDETQCYTSDDDNAQLDGDGHLVITALRAPGAGHRCVDGNLNPFTSARLDTQDRFEFTYGRVEIRAKVPSGIGVWPAFWALGSDDEGKKWPASGEFDVLEYVGRLPRRVLAAAHAATADGKHVPLSKETRATVDIDEDWHTYGVRWTRGALVYTFDGEEFATFTRAEVEEAGGVWPFGHDFYLVLNLAMGGGYPGPVAPDIEKQEFVIDWVRIYRV
ncbi:glycoside hydrolase family 16 protein [Marmoricola sp. OAE513]|uniref:glycoside hydrolase family 16 protein n=1 Tax=Marmoricola sp. OAE513 TaxID=2817894 RepID=UPI001AE71E39